jgi:phosphoesterase RecJ-like protein
MMKLDTENLKRVANAIDAADNILCVSHVAPDGDAIGSLLGAGWMLHHLGKTPTLALHDPVPEDLRFLPGADQVIGPQDVGADYDLILCLDASSPDRMGKVHREADHIHIPLAVVDHHVTNTRFGTANWVEPGCAAACQMLVYLADALEVPLTGPLAECLLTGTVTDTLGFRTSNTSADVMEAAMRLMRGGASLPEITAQTLNRRPVRELKLWGLVLPDMQLEDGVIWVTASRAQLAAANAGPADLRLASILVSAVEANISATFIERLDEDGEQVVECSFRAKPGFDVSGVAFELGGGGHPPASGCTRPGELEEVAAMVVARLQAVHAAQVAAESHP